MSDPVRVLYVGDDGAAREDIAAALTAEDDRIVVTETEGASAGLDHIRRRRVDCVVAEYNVGRTNGVEFLRAVRREHPDLPFVLLTKGVDATETVEAEAVDAGVTDYLPGVTEAEFARLANRIRKAVEGYRTRRAAEESRRILEGTLDAVDDVVVLFDDRCESVLHNRTAVEATGLTDGRLDGTRPEDLVVDADASRFVDAVETAIEGTESVVEARLRTPNGSRPCEWTVSPRVDGGRTDVAVVGRDLTERRRLREELREVLGRIADAFFAVDDGWAVTYCNRQAERLLGYNAGELVGTDLWEAFPKAVEGKFYDRYHTAMETQEPVDFEAYYEPLDAWFDVRAYPSETGLSVYFRDVTDSYENERELERRAEALKLLYRAISDKQSSFEEKVGAVVSVGRRVFDVEYGALSRVDGDTYETVVVDSDDLDATAGDRIPLSKTYCERVVATDDTVEIPTVEAGSELAGRAGNEYGLQCYIGTPVVVEGELYGTLCFSGYEPREFNDWERTLVELMGRWTGYELERRADERRLAAERDRLEEFASVLSHDLRSPLEAARGHLELANQETETGSDHFDGLREQLDRMGGLIESVLTLARGGDAVGETVPVALSNAVEDAWSAAGTDEADLVVADDLGSLVADRPRLVQLLENLFRNAREHGGATVTVTVGSLPDGGFYVADDGPGVPIDERDRVFASGYSTDETGTGLGLAIVRSVVDGHGWRVALTESDAGGARFEIHV
jgi:PAS domain S-box-containing protein